MPLLRKHKVSPTLSRKGTIGGSGRTHTSHSTSTTLASHTSRSTRSYASANTAPTLTQHQIDELAQTLQLSVAVESRKCKNTRKKYKATFVGSEAVDILQQLARLETRAQALEVGRLLQSSLNLFECVNSPKVHRLEDHDGLFYRFAQNTTAAKKERHIPNLDDKMRTFQRGVRLKDRFLPYYYTTYKNCFVGREAVDLMMRHKFAKTRAECVEIGRILQAKYNLFVPVTGNHEFEDDSFKFYRLLLPQKEKEKAPSFLEEIKPARYVIALSLIPACITYYYFY